MDWLSINTIRTLSMHGVQAAILRLYGKKILTIDHQNYVVNATQNKEAATSTREARLHGPSVTPISTVRHSLAEE